MKKLTDSSAAPDLKPQASSGPSHRRLLQLDVLRGVAILLVLFRHPAVRPEMAKQWKPLATGIYNIGWTGVDLFFVLSGFLIGGLLFGEIRKHGKLDVQRFLIRRAFKIWPSYFLLVLFACTADIWHVSLPEYWASSTSQGIRRYLPNLLHVQNYLGSGRGHTWSLSVEEHFYLALPLLLIFLLRGTVTDSSRRLRAIPWVALSLGIICLGLRLLYHHLGLTKNWNYACARTEIRADSLFFGVFLAYLHHFKPQLLERFARHRGLALGIAALMLVPFLFVTQDGPFSSTIGFTMLYLAFGAILVTAVYSTPSDWLGRVLYSKIARGIAMVGLYSYSIYLWHIDLAVVPFHRFILPKLVHFPAKIYYPVLQTIFMAWAVGIGIIAAKLIEGPALALRDKLFPARVPLSPANVPTSTPQPVEPALVEA